MARGLAQAQERLEGREDAPAVGHPIGDVLLRRDADRVVDVALDLVELDVEHDVGARRKLGQRPRASSAGGRTAGSSRAGAPRRRRRRLDRARRSAPGSRSRPPRRPGVREMHHAPELFEPVLDRRAAQRDAKLPAELERGARGLAAGVLDRLRLVEDDDVPQSPARGAPRRGAGRHRSSSVTSAVGSSSRLGPW